MPVQVTEPQTDVRQAPGYLGRQPIVDAGGGLFGYELYFGASQPDDATRQIIDHWLTLVPGCTSCAAFIPVTPSALLDGTVALLPPASTVLQIPPLPVLDAALIEACKELKYRGYRLALERFLPDDPRLGLCSVADFVSIDFAATGFQERRRIYAQLPGTHVHRLARNIDTDYQKRIALSEGCTLLQGCFFSQPTLVATAAIPRNQVIYLQLIGELAESPVRLPKVEKLISSEPSLCYRLLRVSNSALQGHAGAINSVHEALLLVGEDAVRRMVTVAMTGTLADHRSPALLSMALCRARFAELLAPLISQDPAQLFLAGLLSLLDALLGTTMESVLRALPVSPALKQALLGDSSSCSRALELLRNLESCDWEQCDRLQYALGRPEGSIAPLYVESLQWASSMLRS